MKSRVFAVLAIALASPAFAGAGDTKPVITDFDAAYETGVMWPVDGVNTSAQPDEAALELITDNGFAAVIDLRGQDEARGIDQQAIVEDLGMTYIALPIEGQQSLTFANAEKLDAAIAEFDAPVLIHCDSGDRAGALLALRAALNGAEDTAAIQLGQSAGMTSLEPVVRERLADGAPQKSAALDAGNGMTGADSLTDDLDFELDLGGSSEALSNELMEIALPEITISE